MSTTFLQQIFGNKLLLQVCLSLKLFFCPSIKNINNLPPNINCEVVVDVSFLLSFIGTFIIIIIIIIIIGLIKNSHFKFVRD